LLDERAVVLLPGAAAREGNALPPAVVIQDAVDEFRAVVAIEPDQGHRQAFPYCLYPRRDPIVTFPPERLQLDPAGRHVDGAQGVQVEPLGAAAAVRDEIDLTERSEERRVGKECRSRRWLDH